MRAYWKDIVRTIQKSKKRFFSILIITALGVTMFAGLSAGCRDLRQAGDNLFDEQHLYDISVQSTLGLTDEDVRVLSQIEGVDRAEGVYSETVHTKTDGKEQRAEVKVIKEHGLTQPKLLKGALPANQTEIAVTEKYCKKSGKNIGDTLILEPEDDTDETDASQKDEKETDTSDTEDDWTVEIEEEKPQGLNNFTYKITAVVLDPADLIADEGAAAYRASSSTEYTFFVNEKAADGDIYTAVHLTVSGARELLCYSEEYEEKVNAVVGRIENEIKDQREQARYDAVTAEAFSKIDDAQKKIDKKFDDADQKISDAKKELSDGQAELQDGAKDLKDGELEIQKQEKHAEAELAKAKKKLSDGYSQIKEAKKKLEKSEKELKKGEEQLAQGKKELKTQKETVYSQISAGKSALVSAQNEASGGKQQIEAQITVLKQALSEAWPNHAWETYVQNVQTAYTPVAALQTQNAEKTQIAEAESAAQPGLTSAENQFLSVFQPIVENMRLDLDTAISMLDPQAEDYQEQLTKYQTKKSQLEQLPGQAALLGREAGKVNAALQSFETQLAALEQQKSQADSQFAQAEKTLKKNEKELKKGKAELKKGIRQLKASQKKLQDGRKELVQEEKKAKQQLAEAKTALSEAQKDLNDGKKELADGEKELYENEQKLADGKQQAADELADARQEVNEIDMTKWYVQDRNSLGSYTTIESDAASIETIGTVFPILFLSVAILISLTTITRMVEDERGLIGTYKALGYHDIAVYGKFLLYACIASLLGGIAGIFCGFVALPKFLFYVFAEMYIIPSYPILFHAGFGICGILLFEVGVAGAAFFVCRSELRQTPAELMRPKAPRAGSRVFLEKIPFLWKRMSFLNKVTMRNLFRYKKRLFMTVGGIMGCTALILVGMAIKDSVTQLMPNQYDHVYRYDLMAVTMEKDNDAFIQQCSDDDAIADYLNVRIETVKAKTSEDFTEESVQLIVAPEKDSLKNYILLESTDGKEGDLRDDGVYITQNLSSVLNFKVGDTMQIQDIDLTQKEVTVAGIVKNYLGNTIYMTRDYYEKLFDEYHPNGILAHLSDSCEDHTEYAENLARKGDVISAVSTQSMRDEFSKSFSLINSVVVLVTFLAAVLAFVVLFTLSTTNISERERELATIKVLGFFDREVHLYINKETLLLTAMGIILGLPVGRFFSGLLTSVLKLPAVHFAVYIRPFSYLFAAAVTFIFALVVNLITNRSLDRINMVDALKSVE